MHCSTCDKHSYDLHPTFNICFDCFKAGESAKFNRMKVVSLTEYKQDNALRLMRQAYHKAFENR